MHRDKRGLAVGMKERKRKKSEQRLEGDTT